jgi:uncharacterized protein (TIGR03435 family)
LKALFNIDGVSSCGDPIAEREATHMRTSSFVQRVGIAAALILTCPALRAQGQSPAGPLVEFEVASIKPNKSNDRMYYGIRNGSMTVRNMTVKGLIQIAYGKRDFQIAGGPAWINSEYFDIDAKAERPLKANHEMERSLLASRFHLEVHKETKLTSVYSLVVATSGLKMKVSADQSDPEKGGPKQMGPGRLIGDGVPMYVITNLLSNMLGRTVVNDTGLAGKFDVHLQFEADSVQSPSDEVESQMPVDVINIAIIDAIEKQLGLKIKTVKAAEETLVIDRIEHPSAN